MHALYIITSETYQSQKISKGNHERTCSYCFTDHGKSVILHSALQRATLFLSSSATRKIFSDTENPAEEIDCEGREAFQAFLYWCKQDQVTIDAWVEARFLGRDAGHVACQASRPKWKFTVREGRFGGVEITAVRGSGRLEIRHAADSWEVIHTMTA
jgi:hypothetical protein